MDKKYKKERPAIDIQNLVYGKVPPHALEIEKLVLGTIMMEKHCIDIVCDLLTPDTFYLNAHVTIFTTMLSLNARGQSVDIEIVVNELKNIGELESVGGPYYVTTLTNSVTSSANIEQHCQIIKQKYIAREAGKIGGELAVNSYDGSLDAFDLIEEVERKLTELTAGGIGKAYTTIDTALMAEYQRIEAMRGRDDVMTGIPSGFTDMDRITNGWQNTDLIILAARPAVGKTAFALNIARNAAMNHFKPTPVLFFTLEMSTGQLTQRMLSAESEILLKKIRNGNMDDDDMRVLFTKAMSTMVKALISIDDTGSLSLAQLRSKARKWARKMRKAGHIDLFIIIDYLQLMSGSGGKGNREQEISEISRGLKALAKELNIPIMALSQLSRSVEQRSGEKKMPQLSDLRESGAIEQDADMVMFIYRPEYYDENSNAMGESTAGETHIKIAKHRSGELDTVKLRAQLSIQKFFSWDESEFMPQTRIPIGRWAPVRNFYENEKDDGDLF